MKQKSPHRQHMLPAGADFRGTTLICLSTACKDRISLQTESPYLQPAPEIGANCFAVPPYIILAVPYS